MNRLKILATLLAAAVALVSCYWTGNMGQGGLVIDISGITPKLEGEAARVYLLADGRLFSAGGGVPFTAEVPYSFSGQTQVSIQGLPVGPQYQALIGIGQLSAGVFSPFEYCKSGLFQVSPGTDTTVEVSYPSPINSFNGIFISSELMGRNLKGVVDAAGMNAYTAEEAKLHLAYLYYDDVLFQYVLSSDEAYDLVADPNGEGVGSFRINGLSDDGAGLTPDAFISAPSGVLPFYDSDGMRFLPAFSSALGGDKDILESASFLDGADYAFFFRRAGGLGGTRVGQLETGNYGSWSWVNLDVPGLLDLAVSDNNAYFAATGGAFALPPAFLTDSTPTLAEHRTSFSAPAPIVSLDFLPSSSTLFMGTTNGVWEAYVDEATGISVGTPSLIPGTEGQRIEHIAVSRYNPSVNQAFLSNYWLYLRYYGSVYEIPFFAVLPGKPTGMAWDSSGVLYISGTEGLSAVWVGAGAC